MRPVVLECADGVRLHGHLWETRRPSAGRLIINAATGVAARYYHRYAAFLAKHGFEVLTWDYRGIGLSRPERLRGSGYLWRDWGEKDFAAALRFMVERPGAGLLSVVGHSIGGFLPGLAAGSDQIDRMLTVGAQYAWPGDYAPRCRATLWLKWHLVMPALTALCGYFPGKRLGWLEDLPAGVAYEWAFRRPRFELSHPAATRPDVLARMAAVRAEILAVIMSDDEFGTLPAVRRALGYYRGAARRAVRLDPADFGRQSIGHFQLFHSSHEAGFWQETLLWLREGRNPWPDRVVFAAAPEPRSYADTRLLG
ncbi:alpha/beta hydrolase family protein [Paracoccus aminophilus]|uniref:Alpha/beta hydrolase n=1 Tax=Paracoccus aminophilus JCM 7686 TaxID=1367847 RepID=S5XUM3_PARAH|nr:alpha/beta fold hydrolase [Paracoccus aminophilus]AGT11199.1 alpha/beta hydrolase [Paracoccus aminophilus JCM 7686]